MHLLVSNMKSIVGIAGIFFLSRYAYACSFPAGYQNFLMAPSVYRKDAAPELPKITVKKIERGEKGHPGVCADPGVLVLKIDNFKLNTGYSFTIEDGVAEDRIFPEGTLHLSPVLES